MKNLLLIFLCSSAFAGVGSGGGSPGEHGEKPVKEDSKVSRDIYFGVGGGPSTGGTKPTKESIRIVWTTDNDVTSDYYDKRSIYTNESVTNSRVEFLLKERASRDFGSNSSGIDFRPTVTMKDFIINRYLEKNTKNEFASEINNWKQVPEFKRENAIGCLNSLDYLGEIKECMNFELNSN